MARTALDVGGTSGIGAATALRLAADCATVLAAGLNTAAASPELQQAVELHELDLRTPGALEELITSRQRLDVLVNAAGIIRRGEEHRPEVFAEVVEINLTGAMRAAAAAHELLAESKGCIVNVASMLSYFGGPLVPGYSASTGRDRAAHQVARGRVGRRGDPGQRGCTRLDRHRPDRGCRPTRSPPNGSSPVLRWPWGRAAEVAGAIAFLTGPDATFITGAVLPVDGGYQSN